MKLLLLSCVIADEPNADCDYIEIGLVCRSDCEDAYIGCNKSCYGDDGFINVECERNCLKDVVSCEEHCPCFTKCPNGCPCGNTSVDQKYC